MQIVYNINMKKSMTPVRNAFSIADAGGKAKVVETNLPPKSTFSKFGGNKGNFGFANVQKIQVKAQFTPPAIRVTQNKGGGGK
jgi:hypothetical protein